MYLLLIFQQFIAAGTHIFAKSVTNEVSPPVVLLFRVIIVSLIFAVYLYLNRIKFSEITKRDWMLYLLLGFVNIPINQFLFLKSMELTTAPNVALAYALTPAFVIIIEMIMSKKAISYLRITGVCLAVIGTIFLIFEKGLDFSSKGFVGDILALLAGFSWAVYTILGRNLSLKMGAIFTTGVSMVVGLMLYIPIFMLLPDKINYDVITPFNWFKIFYLGAITSGVGYAIWNIALKKIESSKVSVFNNIQPILVTLFAIIFLHQQITITFVCCGIIILVGVFISQRD